MIRRQWMGALALFLVLAGGTAWAANEWTGVNIVNESLTGVDVKNDTLRGADVLESSLGKVPDADRLDGFDSKHYVQGASAASGFATTQAKTYFNRIQFSQRPIPATLLAIPGLLFVTAECADGLALVRVVSAVDGLELSQDILGGTFRVYDAGDKFSFNTSAEFETYQGTVDAGKGHDSFSGTRQATMHIVATGDMGTGVCYFQVSALSQKN